MAKTKIHTVAMTLEVEAREEMAEDEVTSALWKMLERNPDAGADLGIRIKEWLAPGSTNEKGEGEEE